MSGMSSGSTRAGVVAALTLFGLPLAWAGAAAGVMLAPVPALAQQQSCERAEFEAVVDEAGSALRDLSAQNRPAFQDKLRLLREKRGWSQEVFLKQAAPFVRDPTIVALDQRSSALLERINSIGETSAERPDCKVLEDLRSSLREMVAAQSEKWSYMFAKIETELAK